MNYLLLFVLAITTACSFKSPDSDKSENVSSVDEISLEEQKILDSDGDLVSDFDERNNGTDPFVADIPRVDVSFLQDYSIEVTFEDESTFKIDTTVARDNP